MTVIEDHRKPDITLKLGAHDPGSDDMCLIEYVAWLAGEPWSDTPVCVCPVLAAFGRSWNDGLPDDETRTRLLVPFAERLVGTVSTAVVQDRRAFMAADWAVRTYTPVWLRAAGLVDAAVSLEQLPALLSVESCRLAKPTIAAASAAARDAARAAARDAAWDAARAAASNAARAAAGDAARDAASNAARAAAGDAARDAARAAAKDDLAPHLETLQASAVDLFDRMINTTESNVS